MRISLKKDREINRNLISQVGNYIEIYVDTSIENCEKRDVKGLYSLARKGLIKEFTRISSPFELPENPELVISDNLTIEESVSKIITTNHHQTAQRKRHYHQSQSSPNCST